VGDVDVVAGVVRGERRDAEVFGQGQDTVLRGADGHRAALGDVPAADVLVPDSPSYPVTCLQDDHRATRGGDLARRGEAGQSGAHDDDVHAARPLPALSQTDSNTASASGR
jgi:hypothetical protein